MANIFTDSLPQPPHPSWQAFLGRQDIQDMLRGISGQLGAFEDITPPLPNILQFLLRDLNDVKILILGQDPYPQQGAATGRCFEVGTLSSWEQPFRNVSLKNIVRAVYHAENGTHTSYKEVLKARINGWHLLPPLELFKNWEEQGVLLLNTAFTCKLGEAGSHTKIWEEFTAQLLEYISQSNRNIIWFIWGKHAENHIAPLDIEHKYISQHPMMCYDRPGRDTDFLFGSTNMFAETSSLIKWSGTGRAKLPQTLFG